MADYDRSATGPLPVDAGPRRAESIFDLSPEDFRASLGEMQAMGHDTDALMRQYRAVNSPFAGINNAAAAQQQGLADSGRRSVLGGLLSKPEGAIGMDALAGLEFEGLGGLLGAGQQVGQAFDAPAAIFQGVVPDQDVNMEALNTAGMAMGAGGAATAPSGALRAGLARDGRVNQVKIGNTNVVYSLGNDGVAEISSIRTPQSGRGQGSARAALQSVISDLQGAGAASVRLIPSPLDNKTSPARLAEFYDSLGFSRTGQAANMAGDEWMSMDLSANASQSGGLLGAGLSEAQRQARDILDMRAAGRAGEVTDDMMARADDQYMFDNTPLPMDEASRLARADAGGFGGDLYHGTDADFQAFDASRFGEKDSGWYGRGVTTDTDPEIASGYANYYERDSGQSVMPVYARGKNMNWPDQTDPFFDDAASIEGTRDIRALGYDGTRMTNDRNPYGDVPNVGTEQVTFDPSNIRSRFARFDPEFSHLSNLSAANASPTAGLLASGAQEQDKPLPFMEMLRGLLR
jgi:ribosomal protein S18 acetylase RimI-like enzyme